VGFIQIWQIWVCHLYLSSGVVIWGCHLGLLSGVVIHEVVIWGCYLGMSTGVVKWNVTWLFQNVCQIYQIVWIHIFILKIQLITEGSSTDSWTNGKETVKFLCINERLKERNTVEWKPSLFIWMLSMNTVYLFYRWVTQQGLQFSFEPLLKTNCCSWRWHFSKYCIVLRRWKRKERRWIWLLHNFKTNQNLHRMSNAALATPNTDPVLGFNCKHTYCNTRIERSLVFW
jgi:hypothetical protein